MSILMPLTLESGLPAGVGPDFQTNVSGTEMGMGPLLAWRIGALATITAGAP
jgi:hypothetical protein